MVSSQDDETLENSDLSLNDESSQSSEEFDFDGHDVDLDSVPSWIDEDQNLPKNLDEGFTFDESDELQDENGEKTPDASELFSNNNSASAQQIAELEEQRDAYLDALRQLQADFENYKKRVVRDSLEDADLKSAKIIEDLLPVLDNFELALKTINPKDSEMKKLKKGIELVFSDLTKVLEKQGLEMIEAQGSVFDPEFHDAVSHEDNDEHEVEVVVEVLRPGYKVRGRVVRPAMVKVAK